MAPDDEYRPMSAVLDFFAKASSKVAPELPPQQRRYDAASYNARFANWYTQGTDADAANSDPYTLRNRARDLVRNNPWGNKALQVIVGNAVGFGIRCQIKARTKTRGDRAQRLWEQWAETTVCDADGVNDFYGLQALAMRCLVESGEVIVRLRPRRPEDRLPVPLQIQIIEPDLLSDNVADATGVVPGNEFEKGIEYDQIGRRVAYHLFRKHPGSSVTLAGLRQTTRVPASEIIHLYRKDRPGQERGVSWFAPVTTTLKDIDLYEQAYLRRQQLANLFAGFMISNDPNDFADELADEIPDLQPGTMYSLRPGTQIEFTNPPPAGEDPAYRDSCLRRVAAGMGITYEAMTGDLSSVNFSSARMGAQEMGRNIDGWLWTLFIPRFCNGVLRWFLDAVTLQTSMDTGDMIGEWTPPARIQVDPSRETQSLSDACRNGFISIPEAIRRQGYDPVAVAKENAEYLAVLDGLGIAVESDFRQSSKAMIETPDAEDSATPDAEDSATPDTEDSPND